MVRLSHHSALAKTIGVDICTLHMGDFCFEVSFMRRVYHEANPAAKVATHSRSFPCIQPVSPLLHAPSQPHPRCYVAPPHSHSSPIRCSITGRSAAPADG